MKAALVAAVAAASAEAALGFAPVAPAAPRSGVLALRAQVRFCVSVRHGNRAGPCFSLTRRTPHCRMRR